MKITKQKLDDIQRCYSTGYIYAKGDLKLLLASEAIDGPCYSYSGDDFSNKEVVWESAGGTMSLIPLPGKDGEFLASQRFFPGFNAKESKVVHGVYKDGKYEIKDFISIPYLHRFDVLQGKDGNYFVGASLCTSKTEREDWSDPGKIYVGKLPDDLSQTMEIQPIQEGLTKNHGYCRGEWNGYECGFVTSDEGVFIVTPPTEKNEQWTVDHIIKRPISDIAICDIDDDGQVELATIEPFHGSKYVINKFVDGEWKIVYEYPNEAEFIHVVWGGKLRGKNSFICGVRRKDAELVIIQHENGQYKEIFVDKGCGPANIVVVNQEDREIIVTANNTIHEAAVYIVED